MRILVIDNVNFVNYPTGGIMAFYRNLLPAFGKDILLAGICTDDSCPNGKWIKKKIFDIEFDFFSMANIKPSAKKPLVPERIQNCFHVKKHEDADLPIKFSMYITAIYLSV